MNGSDDQSLQNEPEVMGGPRWRRKRVIFSAVAIGLILLMFLTAWLSRERLADDFIGDELARLNLPATYEIERIGTREQVFSNVVVGDPDQPDFTAERITATVEYHLGAPTISRVEVVRPRLYGSYREGNLSFGALDRALFEGDDARSQLPDMYLRLDDGRALIESDYGPLGVKLAGEGNLRSGFQGILAAVAPDAQLASCGLRGGTLYGDIITDGGAPRFSGPLRVDSVKCDTLDADLSDLATQIDLSADADFSNVRARANLTTGQTRLAGNRAARMQALLQIAWRDDRLVVDHDVVLRGVQTSQVVAREANIDGSLRARPASGRMELRSDLAVSGLRLRGDVATAVNSLAASDAATPLAPLLRQFGNALRTQLDGASLSAPITVRKTAETYSMVLSRASLTGQSGAPLLALSQVELSAEGGEVRSLVGNFATAGRGLPRIVGRMEDGAGDRLTFRLRMAPYTQGKASLEIPQLTLSHGGAGTTTLAGELVASGPFAGGFVERLKVPLTGRYSPTEGFALWDRCTVLAANALSVGEARFAAPSVNICPSGGGAIMRMNKGALAIAASSPGGRLNGSLGDEPLLLAYDQLRMQSATMLSAEGIELVYGHGDGASSASVARVDMQGGEAVFGTFAGADLALSALAFDVSDGEGRWSYANGLMTVSDGSFMLSDRADFDRFKPMIGRDMHVRYEGDVVSAQATLAEPTSGRAVADVVIRHAIETGTGSADLTVPNLVFDEGLQPENLTELAKGVVALADGSITGTGRVDWNADGITSSGRFSTDDFDFAAAFGPVRGLSGTIEFSDLVNLTTAPGQSLRIASINPGVEVTDGVIDFSLADGRLVAVEGGRWPFMGGELFLRPTLLNFAVEEDRNYVFEIVGLDAGAFVETFELSNLSTTGTFDGTLPIVFDTDGNGRIEQGLLISRAPGGNVSYVGKLTYEDVGAMANFAFDALRSLDYTQMTVSLDGPLTGEIITRFRFDGVSQGADAKRNIVTRQLARIPLQFRINVRAQFYQLLTSMTSLYDPASVRDPRELGLLTSDGVRFKRVEKAMPNAQPDTSRQEGEQKAESVIQDEERENRP